MKIESAMALERKFTGTVSMISVFVGPVERNNKKIASASSPIANVVSLTHKAAAATGAASSIDPVKTQAYPAGFLRCQAVATKPPSIVPTNPPTTITAPRESTTLGVFMSYLSSGFGLSAQRGLQAPGRILGHEVAQQKLGTGDRLHGREVDAHHPALLAACRFAAFDGDLRPAAGCRPQIDDALARFQETEAVVGDASIVRTPFSRRYWLTSVRKRVGLAISMTAISSLSLRA